MSKYTRKIFDYIFVLISLLLVAFANWFWPITSWVNDTPLYRFIWLGIFFIILDILLELIILSFRQLQLLGDMISFSRDLHKLEKGFKVISKPSLPNNTAVDYVIIGPSGVWLITIKDKDGKVTFNGDELVQDVIILKGIMTQSLEKSYTVAELLKNKFNRDFKVAAVIAFMSPRIDLSDMPDMIRGIYISSRQKIKSLIENTDVQILDVGIIEEISKTLKK